MRTTIVRGLSAAVLTSGLTLATVAAAVPAQADPINSTSVPSDDDLGDLLDGLPVVGGLL